MDRETQLLQWIRDLEASLGRVERSQRQLELRLAERDVLLEAIQNLLASIADSTEWKVIRRLGRFAQSLVPPGTRRRTILERIARAPRRLARGRIPVPQPAATPSGRTVIAHSPHPGAGAGPASGFACAARAGGGRVLVIDHRLPSPDRDAGSLRMVEIVRVLLARGHHVSFIPDNLLAWSPYLEQLQAMGVEVFVPPTFQTVAHYLKTHGAGFDLAILSRAAVADRHLGTVRWLSPQARVVFDTVDLHFLRERRAAELAGDPGLMAAAEQRREQELGLACRSDLTVVVSSVEKDLLERECPGLSVQVVPTIYPVDPAEPPGFDGRRDLVFIGGFAHVPNVDAVLWFAHEILPLVGDRLPGAVFQVIGPDPPPEVLALESPRVRILGHVPDVHPIFDRALTSVAPLRYGAGVKGKINHSMALGVPVVATSLAAEGMHLEHEQSVLIADNPAAFAETLVRVGRSRTLWERLSRNGRRSIREHFSVEAATRAIDDLLEWAGLACHSPGQGTTPSERESLVERES